MVDLTRFGFINLFLCFAGIPGIKSSQVCVFRSTPHGLLSIQYIPKVASRGPKNIGGTGIPRGIWMIRSFQGGGTAGQLVAARGVQPGDAGRGWWSTQVAAG